MNNMPPKSTVINVCAIPSAEVGKQCVQLSQSLKSDSTVLTLDGRSRFAHMTVFMARFADSEIPNILRATEQALSGISAFLCEHTGYFMTAGRYLEASYRKSPEFMALHELFINTLSCYRFNPGNPVEEDYFAPYTEEQKQNVRETGYDLAHNLYRPHITLTRYKEGCLPETFPGFAPAQLSFVLNRIGIYKADNNGAIYEAIREFSL